MLYWKSYPSNKPARPGTYRCFGDIPVEKGIYFMAYWDAALGWTDQDGKKLKPGFVVQQYYDMTDIINKVNQGKK